MSRIGKKTVPVPNGVQVAIDGQTIKVKGPKGELSWTVAEEIEIRQDGGELVLAKKVETTRAPVHVGSVPHPGGQYGHRRHRRL